MFTSTHLFKHQMKSEERKQSTKLQTNWSFSQQHPRSYLSSSSKESTSWRICLQGDKPITWVTWPHMTSQDPHVLLVWVTWQAVGNQPMRLTYCFCRCRESHVLSTPSHAHDLKSWEQSTNERVHHMTSHDTTANVFQSMYIIYLDCKLLSGGLVTAGADWGVSTPPQLLPCQHVHICVSVCECVCVWRGRGGEAERQKEWSRQRKGWSLFLSLTTYHQSFEIWEAFLTAFSSYGISACHWGHWGSGCWVLEGE